MTNVNSIDVKTDPTPETGVPVIAQIAGTVLVNIALNLLLREMGKEPVKFVLIRLKRLLTTPRSSSSARLMARAFSDRM